MTFGSGCLLAIGIVFVLFGGCTVLVWSGPPSHELGDTTPLAVIGGIIALVGGGAIWGAVHLIRRRRAAFPPPPAPPEAT